MAAAVAVSLAAYLAERPGPVNGDFVATALVPVALVTQGSANLSRFVPAFAPRGAVPYFLHANARGAWSVYSIVPGVLLAPFYAAPAWWAGRTPRTSVDWVQLALRWQRVAAAAVTAASVGVFLLVLRDLGASVPAAAVLACGYALGSEAFSVSARGLWQHGPASLALLSVILAAVRYRTRPAWPWALAGGAALGLAVAIRPFVGLLAVPVGVWGMGGTRRFALRLAWGGTAVALAVTWPAWNLWVCGDARGPYLGLFGWPETAAYRGLLASPARGLLPYFPAALLAIPGFMAARRGRGSGLASALGLGALLHLALLPVHQVWAGGHGFGPRYMAELQPVLLLLALPWLAGRQPGRLACAAGLVGWGVAVQAVGGFLYPAGCWDDDPVPVESAPARFQDWRDNPVAREILVALAPTRAAPRPLESWGAEYRLPASLTAAAGATVTLSVTVTNRGTDAWPDHTTAACRCGRIVHLSWHLRDHAGRLVIWEGTRAALGRPIAPGGSARIALPVTAPTLPGAYQLEVTLVQESVGWFEDRGVPASRLRFTVGP